MVCCCCSVAQLSPTLCDPMDYSTPGLPVPHRLRVCPSSCPLYQRCHPAISSSHTPFSFCPQSSPVSSTFPVSQLMIKYQRTKSSDDQNTEVSASASVLPNIYYSRLISLKIDWFDLLDLQGTLRSLLQHHRSNASVLWHSAFFMTQFSQLYMTTGKTIVLTIQTFVSRVISLLSNTLCRFVMAFLPRSNHPLISRLESPSNSDF